MGDACILLFDDTDEKKYKIYLSQFIPNLQVIENIPSSLDISPSLILLPYECQSRIHPDELNQGFQISFPNIPIILLLDTPDKRFDAEVATQLGAEDIWLWPDQATLEMLEFAIAKFDAKRISTQLMWNDTEELQKLINQLEMDIQLLIEDQKAGSEVQKQLLPDTPGQLGPFAFEYLITPSLYISGDHINYFQIDENNICFYLTDISGHGTSTAFMTALISYLIHQIIKLIPINDLSCAEILRQLNQALLDSKLHKHATFFIGILNVEKKTLQYCGAGHYPHAVISTGTSPSEWLRSSGLPLGLDRQAIYTDQVLTFSHTTRLYLLSDGALDLIEADSLQEKESRLLDVINECRSFNSIRLNLGLQSDLELKDDVSLFMIEYKGS